MASKKTKAAQAEQTVNATQTAAAEVETKTTLEPVQLTVADLQMLSRIVDLASRRGAFQAGELSQVGEAFNKLTGFLAYVDSIQTPAAEDGATTEAAPATEETA